MNFNSYSNLEGQHAFLSPSKYHWINYSEEKLSESFKRALAVQQGVKLHALACDCIRLGVRLPKSKTTLSLYVNDAISFRMTTEQKLFYSSNCFGTCDAISFRKNILRIHDLKTGESPTSMRQLEIYAALYCLEYKRRPDDIRIELRIYQNDTVLIYEPLVEDVKTIMDKIIMFDKLLEKIKSGEER